MENLSKREEETLAEQYRRELIVKIEKLQKNNPVIFDNEGKVISKYKTAYEHLKKEICETLLKYCYERIFSFYCIPNTPNGLELALKMKEIFHAEFNGIKKTTLLTCDINAIDEQIHFVCLKIIDVWWSGCQTVNIAC